MTSGSSRKGAPVNRGRVLSEEKVERLKNRVAEDMRELMYECGMEMKDVAAILGVTDSAISVTLSGKYNLSICTIANFAEALGLECEVVFLRKTLPGSREKKGST